MLVLVEQVGRSNGRKVVSCQLTVLCRAFRPQPLCAFSPPDLAADDVDVSQWAPTRALDRLKLCKHSIGRLDLLGDDDENARNPRWDSCPAHSSLKHRRVGQLVIYAPPYHGQHISFTHPRHPLLIHNLRRLAALRFSDPGLGAARPASRCITNPYALSSPHWLFTTPSPQTASHKSPLSTWAAPASFLPVPRANSNVRPLPASGCRVPRCDEQSTSFDAGFLAPSHLRAAPPPAATRLHARPSPQNPQLLSRPSRPN